MGGVCVRLKSSLTHSSYFSFSSLICDSSVRHHMYADDNQLIISFATCKFSAKIAHRQTTVDLVSQWMSCNLLSLNQSKNVLLLVGLPAQLPKISDPSLLMPFNAIFTATSSARILCVIFDSKLSMSDHNSSWSFQILFLIHP
jgi:hypothetical protein